MWWIPTAIFDRYKVLILTDDSLVDDEIADKLRAFVAEGGKILASGESALYADGRGFAVDLGAEAVGKAKFVPSYLRPKFEMNGALERGVCHLRAIKEIRATGEVIGVREDPYFERTTEHFSSHAQTPNDISKSYPHYYRA